MIGQVIGTYKIQEKLGEGGMGAVYKGVDTMLDREVAIKALRPELASQTAVVERFRTEAVTLAKLHHPNIATLYSLFRQGDELYMVLEYVRGETLDSILQRRGALSAEVVIPVFCQILDGINHAHEFGIIHRDIKPANMMLTDKGILKVLDFGIARLLGSNRMTRAGNIIGTLEYMAPEQVKGQETDARSDIYALGMMLYEVLTGRLPFETENEFELMKRQIEEVPPNPRSINPAIPEEVAAAIMRSIEKDPAARFQTAGDFRDTLINTGFAGQGEARRITLPRGASHITSPPVSNPGGSGEQSAEPQNAIKETRLGAPISQPHEIKETRLGESATAAVIPLASTYNEETSGSFFDNLNFNNLTWVHYAGAGGSVAAAAIILFFISIFAFSGSSKQEKTVIESNPTPAPTIEIKTQKVEDKIKPNAPTPVPVSQPVVAENPANVQPVTPIVIDTEKPADSGGGDSGGSKKAVAKTVRTPRPTPVKTPVRDSGRRTRTREETRCALTGDCE